LTKNDGRRPNARGRSPNDTAAFYCSPWAETPTGGQNGVGCGRQAALGWGLGDRGIAKLLKGCFLGLKYEFFLVLGLLTGLCGCGYQLQATNTPKGIQIPSLAIPMMPSPSSSLGFEADFTMMIRKAFVSHSQIPLTSRDQAAFILLGEVREIDTEPLSYRVSHESFEVTSSRWLKITLAVKLMNRADGEIVWDDEAMEEKAPFTVDSDPLRTRYNQRKAARRIAQLLAERIYLRTMERF